MPKKPIPHLRRWLYAGYAVALALGIGMMATGDRQRYAELSAFCDARIRDLISNFPAPDDTGGLAQLLAGGHAELFAIGGQLDRLLAEEVDAAAIARAVIDLGHSLRLKVIAEGVETVEQLAMLRRYGCHEMQGYFYSRPIAAEAFAALLAEGRLLPAPVALDRAPVPA